MAYDYIVQTIPMRGVSHIAPPPAPPRAEVSVFVFHIPTQAPLRYPGADSFDTFAFLMSQLAKTALGEGRPPQPRNYAVVTLTVFPLPPSSGRPLDLLYTEIPTARLIRPGPNGTATPPAIARHGQQDEVDDVNETDEGDDLGEVEDTNDVHEVEGDPRARGTRHLQDPDETEEAGEGEGIEGGLPTVQSTGENEGPEGQVQPLRAEGEGEAEAGDVDTLVHQQPDIPPAPSAPPPAPPKPTKTKSGSTVVDPEVQIDTRRWKDGSYAAVRARFEIASHLNKPFKFTLDPDTVDEGAPSTLTGTPVNFTEDGSQVILKDGTRIALSALKAYEQAL